MKWTNIFSTTTANLPSPGRSITKFRIFSSGPCDKLENSLQNSWQRVFLRWTMPPVSLKCSSLMDFVCLMDLWKFILLRRLKRIFYQYCQQSRMQGLGVPGWFHKNQPLSLVDSNFVEDLTYQAKWWECIKIFGLLLLHRISCNTEWIWFPRHVCWELMW